MKPLQVGERVAFYTCGTRYTGTVNAIEPNGLLLISYRDNPYKDASYSGIHPKQCRRLKPRSNLREYWVLDCGGPYPKIYLNEPKWDGEPDARVFKVREVLKPKEIK